MSGTLYLVATPIGNMKDISSRAISILSSVDAILSEDTRNSIHLLRQYNINTELISFHEYSSEKKLKNVLNALKEGQDLALVSDAGTPLISDPGYFLVKQVLDNNFKVISVPGPSALISALVASGLSTNKFIFEGFPPRKKLELRSLLKTFEFETRTIIFYESPKRIINLVESILKTLGDQRRICVAREISKIHEMYITKSPSELLKEFDTNPFLKKGEAVVILEGATNSSKALDENLEFLFSELKEHISLNNFSKIFSKVSNLSKKEIYNKFIE